LNIEGLGNVTVYPFGLGIKNKILRPADLGWYQVLLESNKIQNYLNLGGYVMLTRYRFKEIRHIPGEI